MLAIDADEEFFPVIMQDRTSSPIVLPKTKTMARTVDNDAIKFSLTSIDNEEARGIYGVSHHCPDNVTQINTTKK